MIYIALHEFNLLFFKIKTIVITGVIFFFVFGFGTVLSMLNGNEISYFLSLSFIFAMFGIIFISALSHQIISSEEENTTIRLLLTKVKRLDIVIGKFVGVFSYWFIIILIQYMLIYLKTKNLHFELLYSLISFVFFGCALNVFISCFSKNSVQSNFLSLIISILLTSIFVKKWFSINNNFDWSIFLLPQTYIVEYYHFAIVLIFAGLLLIFGSYIIVRKRDY